MQDRFLDRNITVGDMERLRTLRRLKMALQNELTKTESKRGACPQDILHIKQRQKEVQKALEWLENYLFTIELCNQ